jgi:hypothetical protein
MLAGIALAGHELGSSDKTVFTGSANRFGSIPARMLKRERSSGSETSIRERIPQTTAIEALPLYRIPHSGRTTIGPAAIAERNADPDER